MTAPFLEQFFQTLDQQADAPFWVSRTATYTYADLVELIKTFCGLFDLAGAKPSDTVQIVTADDWLGSVAFLAAVLDGKCPYVQAPDAGLARLSSISERTKPGVKIIDPEHADGEWSQNALIVGEPNKARAQADRDAGHIVFSDVLSKVTPRNPSCPDEGDRTAYLLFTSGTTDKPKGVEVGLRGLAQQLKDIARVYEVGSDSRIFNGLVIFHADGLIQGAILAAFAGACVLRPGKFAFDRLEADLEWLEMQKATHMVSSPAIYSLIDKHAAREDYFDRPEFRGVLSSAAPLDIQLWQRFEKKFNTPMINEYGMTETVAASHFAGPHPEMGARYTIGKPIGCEASVQDEDGKIVPEGEVGELCLRGDIIFRGYYQDPARTAAAFRGDWLRTGDLVRLLEDGSYAIAGRLNSVINSGGFNIQPEEIDEALMRHAAVEDCKTIGMPHPEFGEIPVSAVVSKEPVTENELFAHCRTSLESWKQPRQIVFLTELPRNASGKIDSQRLVDAMQVSNPISVDAGDQISDQLIALAALVFNVERSEISIEDGPDEIESWDSFTHMTFAIELENNFNIKLKPRDLVELETLADFRDAIEERTAE